MMRLVVTLYGMDGKEIETSEVDIPEAFQVDTLVLAHKAVEMFQPNPEKYVRCSIVAHAKRRKSC